MGAKIRHSVDGRYDVMLDADDVEIVRLMLLDKPASEVTKELRASGRSLSEIVSLLAEAKAQK